MKLSNSDQEISIKRVNLLSSSFSGSTLLGILISQHPSFLAFGDTYIGNCQSENDVVCTCGDSVNKCYMRRKIIAQLARKGIPKEAIYRREYSIPFKYIAKRFGGMRLLPFYKAVGSTVGYEALFSSFLKTESCVLSAIKIANPDVEYYFDGSKRLVRAQIFAKTEPDCQIIHLIRHPYEVLLSGATRHDAYKGKNTIKHHAKNWCNYNLQAAKLTRKYPERSVTVRLNDLTSEPQSTMEKLHSTMRWPAVKIDYESINPKITHVVGNRSRHKAKSVRKQKPTPVVDLLLKYGLDLRDIEKLDEAIYTLGIKPTL